jgi:hypothetical protein
MRNVKSRKRSVGKKSAGERIIGDVRRSLAIEAVRGRPAGTATTVTTAAAGVGVGAEAGARLDAMSLTAAAIMLVVSLLPHRVFA